MFSSVGVHLPYVAEPFGQETRHRNRKVGEGLSDGSPFGVKVIVEIHGISFRAGFDNRTMTEAGAASSRFGGGDA